MSTALEIRNLLRGSTGSPSITIYLRFMTLVGSHVSSMAYSGVPRFSDMIEQRLCEYERGCLCV